MNPKKKEQKNLEIFLTENINTFIFLRQKPVGSFQNKLKKTKTKKSRGLHFSMYHKILT